MKDIRHQRQRHESFMSLNSANTKSKKQKKKFLNMICQRRQTIAIKPKLKKLDNFESPTDSFKQLEDQQTPPIQPQASKELKETLS